MFNPVVLHPNLYHYFKGITKLQGACKLSEDIYRSLKSKVWLCEEPRIICEENHKRWRLITYKKDIPYTYSIHKSEHDLTISRVTETGLSATIWDYYVFPLSYDLFQGEEFFSRPDKVYINGWERENLANVQSKRRWDFFFRPQEQHLTAAHDRFLLLTKEKVHKLKKSKTLLTWSILTSAISILAGLSISLASDSDYTGIASGTSATLGIIGFLLLISIPSANTKKKQQPATTQKKTSSLAKIIGLIFLFYASLLVTPLVMAATVSSIINIFLIILVTPTIISSLYKIAKRQNSLTNEIMNLSTIEFEIKALNEQIPEIHPTYESLLNRITEQIQQSENQAIDTLNIDPKNLLNLDKKPGSLISLAFSIIDWGGIQSTSRINQSTISKVFHAQKHRSINNTTIFATYYVQLIFVTKSQVVSYNFFYNAITDSFESINTDEYYLTNIVSVSSKLNEWQNSSFEDSLLQKLTFRLSVENGDAIEVSLLETKPSTTEPQSAETADASPRLTLPGPTKALNEGKTNAEMAIMFIRRQLKELKRKEPTPAGV